MSRAAPLPERLRYLQPFRKRFAGRRIEECDEVTGYAELMPLLLKRITGHSADEAEKLLDEDAEALNSWLSAPEQANDCLHFAAGVFQMFPSAELVKQIWEEADKQKEPLPWVEMDLWPDVKPRRFEKERDGGMFVKWKGLMFSLGVQEDERRTDLRPHAFWDGRNKVTCSPVQFGDVAGKKWVEIGENRFGRPNKRIIYTLAVPGGHVEIHLSFLGKKPSAKWDEAKLTEYLKIDTSNWDESPVESFFHTIRITTKRLPND